MQPKDLINRLEHLGAIEPKIFCYLEDEDGNDYDKDLCIDCAEKMMKETDFVGYVWERCANYGKHTGTGHYHVCRRCKEGEFPGCVDFKEKAKRK